MFFTWTAKILAFAICLFGALKIYMGYMVAQNPGLAGRYFSSSKTPGEVIDLGIYTVLVGIVFGVLAEISLGLRKKKKSAVESDGR